MDRRQFLAAAGGALGAAVSGSGSVLGGHVSPSLNKEDLRPGRAPRSSSRPNFACSERPASPRQGGDACGQRRWLQDDGVGISSFTAAAASVLQFLLVDIDGDRLTAQCVSVGGRIAARFELRAREVRRATETPFNRVFEARK